MAHTQAIPPSWLVDGSLARPENDTSLLCMRARENTQAMQVGTSLPESVGKN